MEKRTRNLCRVRWHQLFCAVHHQNELSHHSRPALPAPITHTRIGFIIVQMYESFQNCRNVNSTAKMRKRAILKRTGLRKSGKSRGTHEGPREKRSGGKESGEEESRKRACSVISVFFHFRLSKRSEISLAGAHYPELPSSILTLCQPCPVSFYF